MCHQFDSDRRHMNHSERGGFFISGDFYETHGCAFCDSNSAASKSTLAMLRSISVCGKVALNAMFPKGNTP